MPEQVDIPLQDLRRTDRFVPVAIFNNHPGADAEIPAPYNGPLWNNPVVRFLGSDGAELLPKLTDLIATIGLIVDEDILLDLASLR
jgi:hypothetical protein